MCQGKRSDDHPLYEKWKPRAQRVKIFLQMIIGALLPLFIGFHFLFVLVPSWEFLPYLRGMGVLEVTGAALALSAAIELAYMLFTPGPDEAVEPLILGLASCALLIASGDLDWMRMASLVVLIGGVGALFWIKAKFVKDSS